MPLYGGFYPESIRTIEEALSFVKSRIEKYRALKKATIDWSHHAVIDKEIGKEVERINRVEAFLKERAGSIYEMGAESHEIIMDIIRSALEIYLRDTIEAKAKSGLTGFDVKIQEIRRITDLEGLKDRKTDLYDKYYEAPISTPEAKKVEVFISYSHEDKALAGKIANRLVERGIDVFLAHEDIDVSEEWREEIFRHLESCNVLLALLTPNFEKSVWTNQEAGYMRGKKGKIIPLIVGETDIKKFGFLEALQGIPIREDNLDDCVEEIFNIILG